MLALIDNYDSFTYNLYDYLKQLGFEVSLYLNDRCRIEELIAARPEALVFSPGPGKPQQAGLLMTAIDYFHDKVPLLGICLGHQAIGEYFGARLVKGREPLHGKTQEVVLSDDPLFEAIPTRTKVMCYHSLELKVAGDNSLRVIARSEKAVMAIRHPHWPAYGLQFHPESIMSEYGYRMLANWKKINCL